MDRYQICVALDERFGPNGVSDDVCTDQQLPLESMRCRSPQIIPIAARVLDATAHMLGVGHKGFPRLALSAPPAVRPAASRHPMDRWCTRSRGVANGESRLLIFAQRKRLELAQPFSGRSGSWVIQYFVSGVGPVPNRALTTHSRPAATVAVVGTSRPGSVILPSTV
jgi:hypothetical protein